MSAVREKYLPEDRVLIGCFSKKFDLHGARKKDCMVGRPHTRWDVLETVCITDEITVVGCNSDIRGPCQAGLAA